MQADPNHRTDKGAPAKTSARPPVSWRRRLLRLAVKTLALLLIVVVVLLTWACKTETGTRSLLSIVENFSLGSLRFSGVTGRLGDDLALEQLSYTSHALHIKASAVHLVWQPASLWQGQVTIDQLSMAALHIAALPGKEAATLPKNLGLPFDLHAQQLALGRLSVGQLHSDGNKETESETVQLSALTGQLHYQSHQYQANASATTPWGLVAANSRMGATSPYQLDGSFTLQALAQPGLPAAAQHMLVQGKASGNLTQLQLTLQTLLGSDTTDAIVMQGQASAAITPFSAPYLGALHIDVQHFDPAIWQADAPHADLRVLAQLAPLAAAEKTTLGLTGNVSISNASAAAINQHGLPVQSVESQLQWQGEQIQLGKLQVQLPGHGKLQGDAQVQWQGGQVQARLQMNLAHIDLQRIDQRLHASDIEGQFSAQTAKDRNINMQAQLHDNHASLQADASYVPDKQLLNLGKIDLQAATAKVQGTADISFAGQQVFHIKASLKDFDPARWIDTPAGRLQADLAAQGQLRPALQVQAKLTQMQGQYAGQAVQAAADVTWQQARQLQIRQLDLAWGKNSLNAQGNWGQPDDALAIKLDAPDISTLNPLLNHWQLALGGSLKADASLRGRFHEPAGSITAQGEHVSLQRGQQVFSIATLQGKLHLAAGVQGQFDGDIVADQLAAQWGTKTDASGTPAASSPAANSVANPTDKLAQLHLQLSGRRDAHTLTLDTLFTNHQALKLVASGSLQSKGNDWGWDGQLQNLTLNGKPDLRLQSNASLHVSAQAVKLGSLTLQSELGKLQLDELDWTPAALKTSGKLYDLRAIAVADLVKPQYAVSGDLKLNAQWNLDLQEHAKGELSLQRQSGDLRFNDPEGTGSSVALGIRELALQAKLGGLVAGTDGENLAVNIQADGSRLGQWQVKLNSLVAKHNNAWSISSNAPLTGQGAASIPDLQWLGPLINPGLVLKGKLNIAGRLSGNINQPHYRADLSGRELEIAFASEGLLLPNGNIDAQVEDRHIKLNSLQFSNTVTSLPRHKQFQDVDLLGKKGEFNASGDIDMDKETGSIQAQWQQFPLLQRKDRWLVVSGRADIVEANHIWSLNGKVAADGAYFKLPKLPPPSLSSDVVVIRKSDKAGGKVAGKNGDSDAPKKGLKTRVDVSFDMGPRFVFVGRGLDTGLQGSLRLRSVDGSPLQANGSISTVGGAYEGYGQQLAIERGILNFQGSPANPGLNIRALRKGLQVEAGVEVVGTVAAPQVRLVSDPVVPDAEKLSWLVLGRGSDQLAGSDASLLMSAASAIFGGDGSRNVPRDIVQGLGFDEFSIGASSNGNSSRLPNQTIAGSTSNGNTTSTDQVVSIGKHLRPGLVLSVESGLSDASGAIKLSWQLTRRISIIGRTGSESAVDVSYTFSFH